MKISVNGLDLFELSETQKSVIKDYVHADIFDADMKRRLKWILTHLYEEAFKKLKEEWDVKLVSNGVKMVPTEQDEYAQLVFSQPNYKDRKTREISAQAEREVFLNR